MPRTIETWTKHTFACKHWVLKFSAPIKDNPTGGWPIGPRSTIACPDCLTQRLS